MARKKAAALRLEWINPADLAEHPENWRRHPPQQMQALGGALDQVGWAGACLYNERTKRLIDGHARRTLAIERGMESVPVIVGDWSAEDERLILATLDPIAALAQTDGAALKALTDDAGGENDGVRQLLDDLRLQAARQLVALTADGENNPAEHYQGMPEYLNDDLSSWKRLIVHFRNSEDLAAFAELIEQPLTEATRAVWHPAAKIDRYADKVYTDGA